jgi:hypothetical protein
MSNEESPEKVSTELEQVPESSATPPTTTTTWQAIFAPQYNTYYFYNPVTQETTWINPLQQQPQPEAALAEGSSSALQEAALTEGNEPLLAHPDPSLSASSVPGSSAGPSALQEAALAQGIDPLLAHLDPSLLAPSVPGSSAGPSGLPSFTARFNSRTGQFTPASARQPGHLSEHERAKRMSEFYFDVGKWEEELARRGGSLMAEEGDPAGEEGSRERKRKRPSKKDLDRFKEQKRLKKIAKTAWLRT